MKKFNRLFPITVVVAGIATATMLFSGCDQVQNVTRDTLLEDFMIGEIPVTVEIIPEGNRGRPGVVREPLWIVIHETDNTREGADAEAHSNYIIDESEHTAISWHYTVDDTEIYKHLPDDENAYHAGDQMKYGGGNHSGIGIEMCVNEDGDFEQTLENAATLAAFLLHKNNLDIDDVKKHQDFSGKICPSTLIETDRYDEFVEMIEDEYDRIEKLSE